MIPLLTAVVAFFIGYYLREIKQQLSRIEKLVNIINKSEPKETPSTMVEPMSLEEVARRQHEQLMRDINQ